MIGLQRLSRSLLKSAYFFEVKVARGWITLAMATVWLKGSLWRGQRLWRLVFGFLGGGVCLVGVKK